MLGSISASSAYASVSIASASADARTSSSHDPFDSIDLSDHAKATLARAKTEQVAADSLSSQLSPGKTAHPKATSSAAFYGKISTSFMALAGLSEADLKPAFKETVPQVTFSSTMQAFGFSVTASGNANSWSSDIQIRGPGGFSAFDTIWGGGKGMPTAGGGGASGLAPGQGYLMSKDDGKVTFTIADLSASATSIATDHVSASSAEAHFNATTFVIDFATGSISVQRTEMSAGSTSVKAQ